ncbi:snRNA-activating protein complex subunit 4 [Drosophila rhopaloa]|uniref:snRNA-activating protein complex subunit 4 n=1 Tax=Drosophila rhopaloa TaxID=1041015 RepID=A0ABM5H1S3_DRORH|nr:snRNA-activating protein complex subunit 4 [Drosophila rhopaloa]
MDDVEDIRLNQQRVLAEIATLLQTTVEPSDANALVLNQEMQRHLLQVRAKILTILQIVRARFARNEEILVRRLRPRSQSQFGLDSINLSGAILRKGTFRFKGNLFFRDIDGRSCPNNEDYEKRCHTEMFPTDFDMHSRHVWTLLDKKNVIMGIKQQLVDHSTHKKSTLASGSRKRKPIERHQNTLVSLLAAADSSFRIDWNQISNLDVEYRHSSYACEAMWRVYLHPDLKRDDWSAEEDETLLTAASANRMQNWELIAASLDRRSDYQCFTRFHTALRHLREPKYSSRWSEEDNKRLLELAERNTANGVINWKKVVEYFPGRCKSTLIGRYYYVLHPSISHEAFSTKEDMMLFAAVEEYNGKFHCFPRTLFPNRSLTQLRTRYHNVLAQRNKTDSWSVQDDTQLMSFVTEHGASQWLNCATFLGNHSRTSCRTRFLVIKKFLEKNPNAKVEDLPRRRSKKMSVITSENWAQRLQEWQEDPESLVIAEQIKGSWKRRLTSKKTKLDLQAENSSKLSKVDIEFCKFFMYGYNLPLTLPTIFPLPKDAYNLAFAVRALAYKPPIRSSALQNISMPNDLLKFYNIMIRKLPDEKCDSKSPLLSPNWSTMIGFRAMCILSGDCRKHGPEAQPFEYNKSAPPIQLFRQRLRALFYRTTLLSRLESHLFSDLPAALVALPRPTPDFVKMGTNITLTNPEPELKKSLKSEPLSDDEFIGTVKQEVELEYIVP